VFRLLPGAALNVVLTGCLRIDVDLNIAESESIDGEIVLAVSEELAQVTGQSRDELIAQFETNVMRNAPEGVTKESYRDGELEGTRLTLDAVPVAAFNPADETLSIVHEGDHYWSTASSTWLRSPANCRRRSSRRSRASRTRWTCE
jgi:hypothetical protein